MGTTERAYGLERRVALRRPPQDRLKIGVCIEGTKSDNLLKSQRLPRTDGGDPASIYLARVAGLYRKPKNPITTKSFLGPLVS